MNNISIKFHSIRSNANISINQHLPSAISHRSSRPSATVVAVAAAANDNSNRRRQIDLYIRHTNSHLNSNVNYMVFSNDFQQSASIVSVFFFYALRHPFYFTHLLHLHLLLLFVREFNAIFDLFRIASLDTTLAVWVCACVFSIDNRIHNNRKCIYYYYYYGGGVVTGDAPFNRDPVYS